MGGGRGEEEFRSQNLDVFQKRQSENGDKVQKEKRRKKGKKLKEKKYNFFSWIDFKNFSKSFYFSLPA